MKWIPAAENLFLHPSGMTHFQFECLRNESMPKIDASKIPIIDMDAVRRAAAEDTALNRWLDSNESVSR
jgi:hypothetical protein